MPVLLTLKHVALVCGVEYGFLRDVVRRRRDPYVIFKLKKRSGGYRHITVPAPPLLVVQRWIHRQILAHVPTDPISTAYSAGCSPILNANIHCGAKVLIKIDLERFFESISERQVFYVFRGLGYRPLLAFELTRLCTRTPRLARKNRKQRWQSTKHYKIRDYVQKIVGHLPQGAPTSPLLSNLVCRPLDRDLKHMASELGYTVTRYADDIVFSGATFDRANAVALIERIDTLLIAFGFSRNARKTNIVSSGARKLVTGLLVDRSKPSLPRELKDRIRCHLYYAARIGVRAQSENRDFESVVGFRNHLKGLILYARSVEPSYGKVCLAKFNELRWDILAEGHFDCC